MDKTFNISVRDRLAKNLSHLDYVCGNTGYIVQFDFDEEWDAYPIKTAHFIESSGEHHNATVIDNQCEFPQIMNTIRVEVGVYAGDLHVTTPAVIGARRSILSTGGDRPAMPEKNEYDKMMEAINQDAVRAETAAKKAEEKLADMQERYYTPSVSEDGDLSWEANDEEMPDVPTVNIKGVPGDPGKPGDDGYSPSVNINPIDGGHRVTVTDANGAKTFDVMNGEPGEPGVNAENDELFVVRRVNTYSADKTYEEIETAIAQRRVVMLVDGGTVFHYIRTDSDGIVFSRYYESTSNKYPGIWESRATINKNNVLSVKTFSPAKTPNPRKLILTGAVNAEYDGSEAVTVEIPAGGEGGGTGLPTGGEPHQMLVTDADGVAKWEERIIRPPEGNVVEVLPECKPVVNVDDESGDISAMIFEPLFTEDVIIGETYTVYWNGTAYQTLAQPMEEDGITMPVLGDIGLVTGGESTGEPFVMLCMSAEMGAEMGYYAMILPIDGSTDITIKIERGNITYHRLGLDYLPEDMYGKLADDPDETYLEEMVCPLFSDNMFYIDKPFVKKLIVGDDYTVCFNGESWTITAKDWDKNGSVALTGEGRFTVIQYPSPSTDLGVTAYGSVTTLGGIPEEVTLSIVKKDVMVKKIDPMFLPEVAAPIIYIPADDRVLSILGSTPYTDTTLTARLNYNQVKSILLRNGMLAMVADGVVQHYIVPLRIVFNDEGESVNIAYAFFKESDSTLSLFRIILSA